MTRNKLAKFKQELGALRRSQAKARDLERLAKALGRKLKNRGKEPTWESSAFSDLFPLTIPHHGGKDIPPGTKRSILDQLEQDVLAWEIKLDEEESESDDDGGAHGNGSV